MDNEKENIKVVYKTKKSTGKTVTIVFLVFFCLGLISYIGYTEYMEILNSKDNKEEEVNEELYYSEVEELLNKIDDYNHSFSKEYPINDFAKIDNQEKLNYGIYMLTKHENTKNYYKVDDMKDIFTSNFSNNLKVIYEDIDCFAGDGVLYKLNSGTYTLKSEDHGHGGGPSETIDTYYKDGNKVDNIYKIDVNILYSNYCSDVCGESSGYYETYDDAMNKTNPVLDNIEDLEEEQNHLKTTTFTFIKKNSNYLLKSVKVK